MSESVDWATIDRAAERLGVSKEARKKWRQRNGVPPRWQLEIIRAYGGVISAEQLNSVVIPGQKAKRAAGRSRRRVS